MSELSFATSHGPLSVHGWCADTMRAAAELAGSLVAGGAARAEWMDFAGQRTRVAARPLGVPGAPVAPRRPWSRNHRHVPAVRTYENLSWLIERHVQAVLPLAAGYFSERRRPTFEFLLTRSEPDTTPLPQALDASPTERERLLAELARELSRVHSLGFVHGGLAPTALLAGPPGRGRRLFFTDPSRCGPRPHRCRYEGDLALFLSADLLSREEERAFLTAYAAGRRAQDRPVDEARLRADIEKKRTTS